MNSVKGITIYIVTAEGNYPGNAMEPELFANETEAHEYMAELVAEDKKDNPHTFPTVFPECEPKVIR